MADKKAQWTAILLINAVLVGVGVVSLELIFGNWLKANNLNQLNIIRNVSLTFDLGSLYESSSPTITYTRDKYGLRGRFRDPAQIDILAVGGSTTDQRYVTDGETWVDVLQDNFSGIGKTVVVANAGIDGQSTYGHIKNFEWWFPLIPGLKPRIVLFSPGLNELLLDEGNGFNALLKTETDKSLRQRLRENSAVYYVMQTLYGIYLARTTQGVGHKSVRFSELRWTTKPFQSSYEVVLGTRLKEYSTRLEVLIGRTRELGALPVFVTQPGREYRYRDGRLEGHADLNDFLGLQVNGVDYYFMLSKLDEITLSVCRAHQLPCIDLAKELGWEDEDFYDFRHMTPKGSKKAGDLIFRGVKDLL